MKAPVTQQFERELIPAGVCVGRLYSIVDLGTVEFTWQGESKPRHEVRLVFEIPSIRREYKTKDGIEVKTCATVSKTYTFSMAEKANLRKELSSWLGKTFTDDEAADFDLDDLLGRVGMLNIVHKDGTSAKFHFIQNIMPLMAGVQASEPEHDYSTFWLSDFNQAMFETLPERVRNRIAESDEYKQLMGNPIADDLADLKNIPF